jgi:UPF0755 protein
MKRWAAAAGAAFLLGLVVLALGWWLWTGPGPRPAPAPGSAATIQVRIPQGMTLTAAADSLAAAGLVKHPTVFLLGAKLTGKARAVRAGLYELPRGASPRDILRMLTSGTAVQVKVTIPEGLDAEQVAALLAEALGFPAEEFLAVADSLVMAAATEGRLLGPGRSVAAHDSLLTEQSVHHPRRFRWCEGHLAPDTFLFAEGSDPPTVARFLVTTQWARLDSVMAASPVAVDLELARQDLLTLASIVEAEARLADERTRIAAVYVNRLRQGWRLEADPTVAFVLEKKGKRLYFRDLEVDSPFNTYRNRGLPPGPIGNPGLAALQAAAQPDSACRAMYFVSDGRGGHVFSRTATEHEAAVREFRRIRAGGNGGRND